MEKDKYLTWEELADFYGKKTGGRARIMKQDDVYEWATKQEEIEVMKDGSLKLINNNMQEEIKTWEERLDEGIKQKCYIEGATSVQEYAKSFFTQYLKELAEEIVGEEKSGDCKCFGDCGCYSVSHGYNEKRDEDINIFKQRGIT
jgi:hypothetical protein